MATEAQSSTSNKPEQPANKIPTPPSSPIKLERPPKGLTISEIQTPPNMTRFVELSNLIHSFSYSSTFL